MNKTKSKKVTNPFGIFGIIFVTFNSLYPLGISDGNIDLIFQKIKNGNPILTSRFHTDIKTGILKKPVFETSDITVKSRKPFLLIGRLDTFGGFNDCGNEKSLMYIDTTTGRVKQLSWETTPLVKSGAIDCHITHLTGVKTILRLRTRSTTYLCLKDLAYTD